MKVTSSVRAYALAIAVCGGALALALPLDAPASCFVLAVIVASLYGGRGPGLLSIVLTSAAFYYFFLRQHNLLAEPESYPRFAAFLGAVLTVAWIVETRRRARIALEKAFEDISRSESQLRAVVNAIPALAWSARPDGSADFFNQTWLDFTGLPAQETVNWGWTAVIHPDDLDRFTQQWRTILDSGNPAEIEGRLRRSDGEYRWFLFRVNPWRDESGAIVKWYGTNTDIQDRKQAEEALRASERDLRLIVDSIPGLVSTRTPAGKAEFVNRRLLDFYGKSLDEVTASDWSSLVHPEDWDRVLRQWSHSVQTGEPFDGEFRTRRADGVYRWVHSRVEPLRDHEGQIVRWYNLLTDVDDRKRVEEALRASEQNLRLIVDSIPGMVGTYTPAGELEFASQQVRDYTGRTLEELKRWELLIHPAERDEVIKVWSQSVESGRPLDVEFRLLGADGSYRWFHARVVPQKNATGRISRWYGLITDINSEKSAKEALLDTQTRLSRATRFATVGELAASIAHEVNQPLAAVVANGQACLRWLSANPPTLEKAREATERIVRDSKEAGEVVRRIRALFKREASEKAPVDVNEIIGEVLSLLEGEMSKRRVALVTSLQKDLPNVGGDRVQLQQLLFNLLLNGIEAMDSISDGHRTLTVRSSLQPGGAALIEINDSGVGIPDTDKVFEAFFTTKEKGLGMGLTLCRSIIEIHNGRLWAVSQGCGTSFFFTLPAVDAAAREHSVTSKV